MVIFIANIKICGTFSLYITIGASLFNEILFSESSQSLIGFSGLQLLLIKKIYQKFQTFKIEYCNVCQYTNPIELLAWFKK
jgi:hypothetical protein